jgi:uncharacterized RDD family membrane protein YckC
VIHLTLKLCELTYRQMLLLPLVPLAVFFVIFDGAYVVLFTGTLGKTFGKMLCGIEVVSEPSGDMDLQRALVRTAAMLLSMLPAGLGLLPAWFGEARTLHDRLAGTRVIQTSPA